MMSGSTGKVDRRTDTNRQLFLEHYFASCQGKYQGPNSEVDMRLCDKMIMNKIYEIK